MRSTLPIFPQTKNLENFRPSTMPMMIGMKLNDRMQLCFIHMSIHRGFVERLNFLFEREKLENDFRTPKPTPTSIRQSIFKRSKKEGISMRLRWWYYKCECMQKNELFGNTSQKFYIQHTINSHQHFLSCFCMTFWCETWKSFEFNLLSFEARTKMTWVPANLHDCYSEQHVEPSKKEHL